MTRCAAALAALALGPLGSLGCHKAAPEAPVESDAGAIEVPLAISTVEPGAPEPGALPARCSRTEAAPALGVGAGVEVGDALAFPGGVAVALVHPSPAGRAAAIALLKDDATAPRVVDLGPTLGDAPAPRMAWRGGEVVAAAYAAASDDGRAIAVSSIAPSGADKAPRPPLRVPQRRGESLSFDLAVTGADGLLVWDDVDVDAKASPVNGSKTSPEPRGVVKAAPFTRDQAASARDVSPPESDADRARVVPSGAGFDVLWIASTPEPPAADAAGPAVEATGEARAFGWIELVAVDAHGVPQGPVRRLTSPTGHVSAYDVRPMRAAGEVGPAGLLVVARDDGEASDGSGGTLVRVRVRGAENAVDDAPLPTAGLGRGAPSFAGDALFWIGKDEQARLLALAPDGEPLGRPSLEGALDDAQPLLFLGPSLAAPEAGAPPSRMLVAAPSNPAGPLRLFTCGP